MWEKNLNKVLAYLKKAEGTGMSSIEAPRGDDTHVVHLDGGDENVTWWKVRAPLTPTLSHGRLCSRTMNLLTRRYHQQHRPLHFMHGRIL